MAGSWREMVVDVGLPAVAGGLTLFVYWRTRRAARRSLSDHPAAGRRPDGPGGD
jgi:hypothetical protein